MPLASTRFYGNEQEQTDLLSALQNNCDCVLDPNTGARVVTCNPHNALIEDQWYLDHILMERRFPRKEAIEEKSKK